MSNARAAVNKSFHGPGLTPWGSAAPSPSLAVAGGARRSQAARSAARSSRSTVGDLAGVPLLMNAPCSHCEQISTRGSDAAVAPTWPQCGQVIRVSISVATASDGVAHRFLIARVAERFGDERFPQICVPEEGTVRPFWRMLTR
jgi:hypothetical protein